MTRSPSESVEEIGFARIPGIRVRVVSPGVGWGRRASRVPTRSAVVPGAHRVTDPGFRLGPPRRKRRPKEVTQPMLQEGIRPMSTITTEDGTEIYYKDWGQGPVVTFSHGWPLNADAWDGQMHFLANNGFRVIAHDRRGHGRSTQSSMGNDMDGYADDLAALFAALDLRGVAMVGHSTGGGEVARYIGRHGTGRVAKAVLIGAVPPVMVRSESNPEGLPIEVFDGIRASIATDRSQFYKELAI